MSDKINLLDEVAQLSESEKEELLRLLGIKRSSEAIYLAPESQTAEKPIGHFGQRLLAVLDTVPDDMKNDPAYTDPVAWVKKARENNTVPNAGDNE